MADVGSGATPAQDDGQIEIPCLWFFLPLPHPLGLPTGWRSEQPLTPGEVLRASSPTSGLTSSLLIHQLNPSVQPIPIEMADLWSFAVATMNNETVEEPGAASLKRYAAETNDDLSALRVVRTIAEVAVPGLTGEDEEQILRALDLAIDHVRFVQRAVALATQQPIELMSRATLPPMVPTFTGVLHATSDDDPEPKLPEAHASIPYLIPDSAAPAALGLRPEPFDEDLLTRIVEAADRVSRHAAFDMYAELRREAMTQRHFRGNNRMALVALAAAGEVLLDTALLHMLWEEHTPPPVAATYFDRAEGHTARVARNFPPRLGGGWDTESKSPAGAYLRDLVRLRHRVIHAGHEPTPTELEAGWSALFGLEHYLGDRLAAGRNLKRYTRTAMAWLGENGLRRGSRLTRHVERMAHNPNEPDWIDTFGRWRLHVDRALDPSPPLPGTATDELMVYADLLEDGTIRWIIHDNTTVHAALVDPHQIRTDDEIAATAHYLADRQGNELGDRRIQALLDRALPATLTWRPDHEIFPELDIFPATATPSPRSADEGN